jgi:predicted nuclease of predicted toxin-antitoxin system
MRFLDANMARSIAALLKRYDHVAVDVRDIGMAGAADSEIAAYAQRNYFDHSQPLCELTANLQNQKKVR